MEQAETPYKTEILVLASQAVLQGQYVLVYSIERTNSNDHKLTKTHMCSLKWEVQAMIN
jgi:hypothetical protein